MIARLLDWLFPPVVCGTNARLKRLMDGQAPRFSVTPAEVDARLAALQPPKPPQPKTAVERLEEGVDRAVAAAEREMQNEWMDRR